MKTMKVSKKLSINKSTVSNLEMNAVKGGVIETGCLSNCPCTIDPDYTLFRCEKEVTVIFAR